MAKSSGTSRLHPRTASPGTRLRGSAGSRNRSPGTRRRGSCERGCSPSDPEGPRGTRGPSRRVPGTSPRRTRGAQPGNLNALKHGFYAKHFKTDELAALAEATAGTLNGEISLARIAARRVLGLLDEAGTPEEKVALLNAITMAAMRVASLLKTKKYLSGNGDDMGAALQEALKDVALETGS